MPWIAPNGGTPIFVQDDGRMSPAQMIEHTQRRPQGHVVSPHGRVLNDNVARADTSTAEDSNGLICREYLDRSNRPSYEFELARGRDKKTGWMAPFITAPKLMVALSKDTQWNATRRAQWIAEHPDYVAALAAQGVAV